MMGCFWATMQKRAVLAAQLADSKVVEGALAAAPDHLK